jgi:DNA-binding transcriptional regulator YiaG
MSLTAKDSTSAAGTFFARQLREPLIVGVIVVGIGTSTQALPAIVAFQAERPQQQTNSGFSVELREPAPTAIAELRRLTGLTWEQLAQLFNVSRRSVHFWASGSKMAPENRVHLERVLDTVRLIDRGSVTENRAVLLPIRDDGTTLLDQLAAGNYDVVISALGHGRQRAPSIATALSPAAESVRLPRPPEELADASQDSVHEDAGPVRAGRGVRTERGS